MSSAVAKAIEEHAVLIHRPDFASAPTGLVISAFRDWLKETGRPEDFPQISTSRPPKDTDLSLLHGPFRVNRSLRPAGSLVPCPICQPTSPKYLEGYLVWCQASKAIYAIGIECGQGHFGKGAFARAEADLVRKNRDRKIEDELIERLPFVPTLLSWATGWSAGASESDRLARDFKRFCPTLFTHLKTALRGGDDLTVQLEAAGRFASRGVGVEVVHRIRGGVWLASSPDLAKRLGILQRQLETIDFGNDPDAVFLRLADFGQTDLRDAHKWLLSCLKAIEYLNPRLLAGAEFLSAENLVGLERWANHPQINLRVRAQRAARTVTISTGLSGYDWLGRVREIDGGVPLPVLPWGLGADEMPKPSDLQCQPTRSRLRDRHDS